MKYSKTLSSIALAALLASGFSGCSENSATLTGYYIDSAVQGVDYSTSTGGAGQTGSDGSFNFADGDTITFSLGNLVLRKQSGLKDGQKLIENDDKVITLLQSIDQDGDPTNGITITETIKEKVSEWVGKEKAIALTADKSALLNIADLKAKLTEAGITDTKTVTVAEAQAHVQSTITAQLGADTTQSLGSQVVLGNTVSYIDYKKQVRKAPMTAAAAEYHTGTGYGNTLLGSAENKCQNCHNELYDTWKGSMHGKSWVDPIFQSKFQDFLRTHINKIGTNPTGSLEYSTGMFPKVAQTCIKCHAPGAYYAGDFKVTLTEVSTPTDMNSTVLAALKSANETNIASTTSTYDPTKEAAVIAANGAQNKVYKATYQIGHEANREGINCAFCHSIETPRLMNEGDTYTLKKDMRVGPHGPVKAAAGTTLTWNQDATNGDMNKFFRLWGPEKPTDYASTTKSATDTSGRAADGRYTMASKDKNGTNGKTHFTGGPFYGPYGVTGISNENKTDDTNRTALVNPNFGDAHINPNFGGGTGFNHFKEQGKALCLSCHQRSAGAFDGAAGEFMELCSTQMAVTTGADTNTNDSLSSPKCQKCHMERIEGTVLHQWARPDQLWTKDVNPSLTAHFDPTDPDSLGEDNPVAAKWLNSHAFLGGSKTTGHSSDKKVNGAMVVAKIKSGFAASLEEVSNDGSTLVIKTTFKNQTAHMFPGAHPMRRALTRVIVTDENGTMLTPTSVTGVSEFDDITNTLVTRSDKTLHSSQPTTVTVQDAGSAALNFTGKVADLNDSAVSSQRFYSDSGVGKVTVAAVDGTVKLQSVTAGKTVGKVFNSAIVDSNNSAKFTRIYGHETGKMINLATGLEDKANGTFVVRPGFDSNKVMSDTRLSPNEEEIYTLTYNISGTTSTSATYKVYYMQKGANGQFIEASNGFLDQAASDAAKHLVTEVFSDTK